VAKFTQEEISSMARELRKFGLKIPEFTKIGGILAEEMPVDEAALHAAILAINDAVEKRDLEALLADLQLYDAHLAGVVAEYVRFYHELMLDAKVRKSEGARQRAAGGELDVYDELLTQAEIQAIIDKINGKCLWRNARALPSSQTQTVIIFAFYYS
jgi:Ras GTPase-activating-like protein IQGAP2/3